MVPSGYILPALFIILIISSCNPTKYVPANQTLLDRNEININKEAIKRSQLTPYITQKPNKRIFGTRFYLWLYNLSNINKTRWPHNWLRKIGEPPVIFDPSEAQKTTGQIKKFVTSKGYFDSSVSDSTETGNRRTKVFYNINLIAPYKIRNIYYEITDTNIRKLFYVDSVNCLIKRGEPYDVDNLTAERSRFERYIRDRGFYAFSIDYINFRIDSTIGKRQVDIHYVIRNQMTEDNFNRTSYIPHSVYDIKNIYIYPDYNPAAALEQGDAYLSGLDTVFYKGYYFISPSEKPAIRYDLILQSLYLKPGNPYSLTNTEQTQSHLMSLKVYRLVNVTYHETDEPEDKMSMMRKLNGNIMLTLLVPQSYKIELEGTNTSGNLGGAVNLIYQHKNLFHGAELLSAQLRGAYELVSDTTGRLKSIREYGFETSLRIPKFLIPFLRKEDFIRRYNPSTNIVAAYNYQALPVFTRTLASSTFGYTWKSGNYQSHIVNPFLLNLIRIPSIDSIFRARIESSYQAYSYKDVLIVGGGYSFIFNNQKIQKSSDYWFTRINVETAGNSIALIDKLIGSPKKDNTYHFLGQPYAQYIRTDFDVRYHYNFNEVSSIVYRGFFGIGLPYGNSKAMPFEKQYFGGGANSIRAWRVRSLGPGFFTDTAKFVNQTADIKLEFNAEYRFKLFWIMEGALFMDIGNIWTYNYDPDRPGTQFSLKEERSAENKIIKKPFYDVLAVGTGTGLRFDLTFVIARVDLGIKLRDPSRGWLIGNIPYTRKELALVLGIGYPF